AYNRWLADRCAASNGRLRWEAVPPLRTPDAALDELRWAKDHGAVGVLKKGDREAGKWPVDPYFLPFYAEAERLDLPVLFHTGSGVVDFSLEEEFTYARFMRLPMPVINAFHELVTHRITDRYPGLRWGFI